MRSLFLWGLLGIGWAQDTLWAEMKVRGDYVEVSLFWRGLPTQTPLGANFVLRFAPAAGLDWENIHIIARGPYDAQQNPLYRALYLTQRQEDTAQRVSLNLLPQNPPQGTPFSGVRELVGRYRVPIRQFGGLLSARWSLETGEIVLAPFLRARTRFVPVNPQPVTLCPSVEGFHLQFEQGQLILQAPADFFPENLSIRWMREGIEVGQGPTLVPYLPGVYWAEIQHRCGSTARSDTVYHRVSGVSTPPAPVWRIYPNPTSGPLYIEGPAGPVNLELRDLRGRLLLQYSWESDPARATRLDLPGLPASLYWLRLSSESGMHTFLLHYAQ